MSGDVRVPDSIETILDEIEARENAATRGPWKLWGGWGPLAGTEDLMAVNSIGPEANSYAINADPDYPPRRDFYGRKADLEFVAMARTDVPLLVVALRGLLAVNTAAKEEAVLKDTEIGDLRRKVKDLEFTRDTLLDAVQQLQNTPAKVTYTGGA